MDWAQRYVPETARVSKIIVKAYYGAAQKKSYFAGCSQGGRMGLMQALHNPKDFDGIISGAPALDNTGLYNQFAWVANANSGPDGKSGRQIRVFSSQSEPAPKCGLRRVQRKT